MKRAGVFTLAAVLLFSVTWAEAAVQNWKVWGANPPSALETMATQKFCDLVKQRSNGQLSLTLFPAMQFGDSMPALEMTRAGEIHIVANTSSWHTRFVPEWEILSFPYVVKDYDHLRRIQKSAWFKDLEKKYYDKGLKILGNTGWRLPRVVLHRKKAITRQEDIVGVKTRMADQKIFVKPWQDFGAEVMILSFSEVAMGLQTGMVDAMDAPANTIYPQKFYQGAPNITMTNHQMDTFDLIVSRIHWEKVSADQQKLLQEAAEESLAWYASQMDSRWAEDQAKLKKEGVTIHAADGAAWRKKALEIAQKWEERGEWPKGWFKMIQDF